MEFWALVMNFLQMYTPLFAFASGLLLGDALILLAALAGAGKLNILVIFFFGLLGELMHDSFFFYISKSAFVHRIKRKLKLHKGRNHAAELIEKLASTKGGYFVPLFFAKFIYGIRDSVILYVGHKVYDFKKYFLICLAASVCSISIILGLGWLAGRGFNEIIPVFKGFEKGLGLILVSILVLYIVYRLIGNVIISLARRHLRKIGIKI